MFINVREELNRARAHGYAIGAYNTCNLEATKAICRAARKTGHPIIIQVTPKAIEYAGLLQIFNIVKNEIEATGIRAAIHLDHAKEFEIIKECIDAGFRSVMIDGSRLPFAENVALTKKVVDYARQKNVSVEAEIGIIGAGEEEKNTGDSLSDPMITKKFVNLTGIDSVAVSVGNEHGAPTGEKLNLDLLEEISTEISIPLVLHGSSGLSEEDVRRAINLGVCKINIDTKIKKAFLHALKTEESADYRDILSKAMDDVEAVVEEEITLLRN